MLTLAAQGVSRVQTALMKTARNMTHLAESLVAISAPGICVKKRKKIYDWKIFLRLNECQTLSRVCIVFIHI